MSFVCFVTGFLISLELTKQTRPAGQQAAEIPLPPPMHTRGQVLGSHLHTATPNAAACVLSEIQVLKLVLKHCTEPFPGAACGPHAKMSL